MAADKRFIQISLSGVSDRGYFIPQEANYAVQISRMLVAFQGQKMKVDQDLANEMMKHPRMIEKQK